MIVRMAMRNLTRNLRRTLLSVGGIGFALGLSLLTVSLQEGAWTSMVATAISGASGHIVVQGEGFQDEQDPAIVVEDSGTVRDRLAETFPEAVVARRVFLSGLMTSTTGSAPVAMTGLEADLEAQQTLLDERIQDGAWLEGDRDILLGWKLADALQVELGDKVVFMAQAGGDEVDSRLFRVSGIYRTGAEALDAFAAFTTFGAAQEMLQGDDPATQIAVNQRDLGLKQLPATLARQAIERADVEIVPWTVSLKQLKEQMDLDKAFGIYLYGFLGLIAGVGIMNAILMGVMERMREFGIMIAVGMRPRDLATLVLAEGAVVGVAGALAGVALGLLASWPLMVYGIDYGEMMAQGGPVSDVPIDTVMRAAIVPWTFVKYGLAAVAMAVVASIWPAWKATRLEPVETMRQL